MRRAAATAVLVALVFVATSAPGHAQAPEGLQVTAVGPSRFPEVTATVTLPAALAGRDVPPAAFTLLENGASATATVTPLPADELEVMLVIDTSGSMAGDALSGAKQAATAFLGRMPSATRIGVVGFGASPVLASGLSLDRQALAAAVAGLEAGGETALYDAVGRAIAQFSPGPGVHRSIVVLSDGGDTASADSLEGVSAKVSAAGVRLDVAELTSPESNRAALDRLAAAGNGALSSAADPVALGGIYDTVARSLANQYLLSFRARSGGRTELRVRLAHQEVQAEGVTVVDLPSLPPVPSPPTTTAPAREPVKETGAPVGTWALAAGAAMFFAALALVGLAAFSPGQRRAGRARLGRAQLPSVDATALSGLAQRASAWAEQALGRRGKREPLNHALERAGIAIRPGEFAVLVGSAAVVALMVGLLLAGVPLGLLLAGLAVVGFKAALGVLTSRRQARFADQLTDTLQLMAGSLRSGYALAQAFDAVAREGDPPARDEFRRLVVETRLGRDLPDALAAMAERLGSEDFAWVVGAIEINREVGGNLAEVLDNISGTIRERNQLRRQVKALSAEGRLSAYILLGLPFVVALALSVLNPGYLGELTRGFGPVLCGIGVGFMTLGTLWMKKICRLVF